MIPFATLCGSCWPSPIRSWSSSAPTTSPATPSPTPLGGYEVFPLRGKVPAHPEARRRQRRPRRHHRPRAGRRMVGPVAGRPTSAAGCPKASSSSTSTPGTAPSSTSCGSRPSTARSSTRTSWSGRGDGGRHFWFRHPGGRLVDQAAPRLGPQDPRRLRRAAALDPSRHRRPLPVGRPGGADRRHARLAASSCCDRRHRSHPQPDPRHRPRSTATPSPTGTPPPTPGLTCCADWAVVKRATATRTARAGGTRQRPRRCRRRSARLPVRLQRRTPRSSRPTPRHPHGYTKFRAWAVLEHGGDLSAAARAARELRKAAA